MNKKIFYYQRGKLIKKATGLFKWFVGDTYEGKYVEVKLLGTTIYPQDSVGFSRIQ